MPRDKRTFRLLLPLVLLFAQLGAISHAYSHSRAAADPTSGLSEQVQFCAQCQSGSPLLAAADFPFDHFHLQPATGRAWPLAGGLALIDSGARHSFQSRGPPRFS